jgi:ketosteroid isomerase-like protein
VTSDAAEVVRELAAAINGDDVQGLARLLDPEVVQYGTRGGVDQGRVIRGREAVLAYWDEIGETWEWQTFEPEQLIEADGVVVALWQETVRIRDSQSDIRSSTASLIKVRDGKVVEMRGYMDPDEALRAAGLQRRT